MGLREGERHPGTRFLHALLAEVIAFCGVHFMGWCAILGRCRPPPATRYARRGEINIAYQTLGEGPPDLLVAPGFVSHLDLMWADPQIAAFFNRLASFTRLIVFDKPGTGISDPVSSVPTLEERAADIGAVLDAAASPRAALFGFSEGASASVLYAAMHPERAATLVLYGSFARVTPNDDYFPELRDEVKLVRGLLDEVVDNWGEGRLLELFAPSVADIEMNRRFMATFERAAASPGMLRALIDAVWQIDVRDVLSLVQAPTLVLHRRGDLVPAVLGRYVAEHVSGARFAELDGIDHAPWRGNADDVLDAVEEFLTGVRRGKPAERALATVMFTDIVASTERAAALGDERWRQLLAGHDEAVREQLVGFGGREVKTLGDGFLATFTGPAQAIRCAAAIVERTSAAGIDVRAGIHTGECELIGQDVGGLAVHKGRASRRSRERGRSSSRGRSGTSSTARGFASPTVAPAS